MTKPPAWAPKLLRDFIGTEMQTRRIMSTQTLKLPAGSRVTVASGTTWNRLQIIAPACKCCGIQAIISYVRADDLEPLSDTHRPEGS